MPRYWLDSDVLIQAANDAYPFDVAPGFWEFFEEQIGDGDRTPVIRAMHDVGFPCIFDRG